MNVSFYNLEPVKQEHISFRTKMFLLQDAYYYRNVILKIKIYQNYFALKYGSWKNEMMTSSFLFQHVVLI